MTGFNPLKIFKIMSPRMLYDGLLHHQRTAREIVRAEYPEAKGLKKLRLIQQYTKRKMQSSLSPVAFQYFKNLTLVKHDETGMELAGNAGMIRVQALAEGFFLIRASSEKEFPVPFSYSVIKEPENWSFTAPFSEADDRISIGSESALLQLNLENGRFDLSSGEVPLMLNGQAGIAVDGVGSIWQAERIAGATNHGLGEQPFSFDLSGHTYELSNTDPAGYDRDTQPINLNMPVLFSFVNGQAVLYFFDNSYKAFVDLSDTESDLWHYQAVGGELRLYLIVGKPEDVMRRFTELVGRHTLPPLWALGLHQSRWSYYPQSRVEDVIQQFRALRIPCDVIHFDIHYMDGYRCFTWDKNRFPDLTGLLNEMHAKGFKGLSMIDPGIKVDSEYRVYQEGLEGDHFISFRNGVPFQGPVWPGNCHFPDFTREETRQWWGGLYEELLDNGMDAFWNDMNEIALITSKTGTQVPDEVRLDAAGRGGNYAELHNIYGLEMARASTEGLKKLQPDQRPLILTRSGWAGSQRYALHWTGDNGSSFDHLKLSLSMVMNLGLCGIALTGPDVGGFAGAPTPELFARWVETGAFTPFFRIHTIAGSPDQEPWSFGEEVTAISRKYIELRYKLLPYLYTAVWQATREGIPIMRPLAFHHPDDPLSMQENEYYFGDALLIAPVIEEGAREREIYLPQHSFYDFWTNERLGGGNIFKVRAPLDHLPLYVKAGSVIPFYPVQQYVGEKKVSTLTLRAYSGEGVTSSWLYTDDGLTPAYQDEDKHRLEELTVVKDSSQIAISTKHHSGSYHPEWENIDLQIIGLEHPQKYRITGPSQFTSAIVNDEVHILFPDNEDGWKVTLIRL